MHYLDRQRLQQATYTSLGIHTAATEESTSLPVNERIEKVREVVESTAQQLRQLLGNKVNVTTFSHQISAVLADLAERAPASVLADRFVLPAETVDLVLNGDYVLGELQGPEPPGSALGKKVVGADFEYEFVFSEHSQKNVWQAIPKGKSAVN